MNWTKTIALAITGASGAQYGLRLIDYLIRHNCKIYLMISTAADVVIKTETDITLPEGFEAKQAALNALYKPKKGQLILLDKTDWFAPVASGSSHANAMVICPASGGTLSAVATGASNNLIERAADVALKERRPLIMVPREAPYSQIHLENMLKLTKMGAVIIPASPGLYHDPKTIDDLIDFIVARIVSQLGIEQTLTPYWGEDDNG